MDVFLQYVLLRETYSCPYLSLLSASNIGHAAFDFGGSLFSGGRYLRRIIVCEVRPKFRKGYLIE